MAMMPAKMLILRLYKGYDTTKQVPVFFFSNVAQAKRLKLPEDASSDANVRF